jgi:hypothetical protein
MFPFLAGDAFRSRRRYASAPPSAIRTSFALRSSANRHQAVWTGILILLSIVAAYGVIQRRFDTLAKIPMSDPFVTGTIPKPALMLGRGCPPESFCLRGSIDET